LISAVLAKDQHRSPFLHSIAEIKVLASGSGVCSFVKVDRSQVMISHCLVNLARADNITPFRLGSGPECVVHALDVESLVILFLLIKVWFYPPKKVYTK
jgi:hypothetical protein